MERRASGVNRASLLDHLEYSRTFEGVPAGSAVVFRCRGRRTFVRRLSTGTRVHSVRPFQNIPEHVLEGCSRDSPNLCGGTLRGQAVAVGPLTIPTRSIWAHRRERSIEYTNKHVRGGEYGQGTRSDDAHRCFHTPTTPTLPSLPTSLRSRCSVPSLCIDSVSLRTECALSHTHSLSHLLYLHTLSHGLATTFTLRCYSHSSVSPPRSL